MATIASLLSMLAQPESAFLERKPQIVNARLIRRTLVAFANSLSAGEEAVLFIGVRDDGSVEGCPNPDERQKLVREICDDQCYPPLAHKTYVLTEAKNVVAVVVTAGGNGPHFSGPAYVRKGSSSVSASKEVFDDLVYSRNSKTAALIKMKNVQTVVRLAGTRFGREEGKHFMVGSIRGIESTVLECNAHYVTFEVLANKQRLSFPLETIAIGRDDEKYCPRIIVSEP